MGIRAKLSIGILVFLAPNKKISSQFLLTFFCIENFNDNRKFPERREDRCLAVAHFFLSTCGLHTNDTTRPPTYWAPSGVPPTNQPPCHPARPVGRVLPYPLCEFTYLYSSYHPPPLVCAFAVFWRFTPPIPHYLARRECPEAVIPSKGIMSGDFNRGKGAGGW